MDSFVKSRYIKYFPLRGSGTAQAVTKGCLLFRPPGALRRLCSLGRLTPLGYLFTAGAGALSAKHEEMPLGYPLVVFAERSGLFPTVSNLAFFTQGRLSVGTVVPDGPFFGTLRTAFPTVDNSDSLPKWRLPFGFLFIPHPPPQAAVPLPLWEG